MFDMADRREGRWEAGVDDEDEDDCRTCKVRVKYANRTLMSSRGYVKNTDVIPGKFKTPHQADIEGTHRREHRQ